MFKSLKLYVGEAVDLEAITANLAGLGYQRQERVQEEGDFSRRGEIIDIFPFTFELPLRIQLQEVTISALSSFNLEDGAAIWDHKMVIILPMPQTPRHSQAIKKFKSADFKAEEPLQNFIDIDLGDYVVHNDHGIGRFLGLDKIKTGSISKDHLVIEYDRQEKLYVPVDSMHLVQKYISFYTRKPRLNRLGSKEWQRQKEHTRKGIQKLAWEIISLEAMRMSSPGFSYSKDTDWQVQFESTFPFVETPDQITAARDVKQDMESHKPMDRLLCGDVGYGKTEVAMRAAFKAVMDNKQVCYLVPTTILAQQHCQNFRQRLKDFPVTLDMLCRIKTPSQQKSIIQGVARGTIDIVIGTVRLVSDDVVFKDLGLIIIDEEQRFGVRVKEKLKSLRLTCDVLTLTATPIPRTLYLSLMAAKDLSVINTPPKNRLPIKTIVVEYNPSLIVQAIQREIKRGGQVYFVHNRIYDIEKVKEKVKALLPQNTRLALAHGQMHPKYLEEVMLDFLKGNIDVLFSTMIIESGIDIPNVNTIIVNNAHLFGLSDLHQLRGRVGRFDRAAYAYLFIPRDEVLESDARKRLETVAKYTHLGAGFSIAMEDLEIRGAGNILGEAQHGYIGSVGFDLYCRLLREAITNFKHQMVKGGVLA